MAVITDLEEVHRVVTEIMVQHYGDRLAKIILFGSYARGDFNAESDVDYLVLLQEESVSPFMEVVATSAARNDFYLKTFIQISAIVIAQSQYFTSNRIFFREVRKDGKCIYERGLGTLRQESGSVFSEC